MSTALVLAFVKHFEYLLVETANKHLDASQILRKAQKLDASVDRSTVYRTLGLRNGFLVDVGDQHIRRFQIAMDDRLLVRVLHSFADLHKQREAFVNGEAMPVAVTGDRQAGHTLHDKHHQTRSGWNDFVCICLALTLETTLQQNALDNMRAGGKLKGLANLPEADRIDVRKEIARTAGVGDRNVSNVRTILQRAHPILVGALKEGALSINRAHQLCKLPKAEQLEQFVSYSEERATNRVIRRSIPQPREKKASLDVLAVLDVLQRQEARQTGSVAVRVGRHKRTVVLIGEDLSAGLPSQRELKLQ